MSTNATYTETFLEFQENNPGLLERELELSSDTRTNGFIEVLTGRYNAYEIACDNEDLFLQYLKDTFKEHRAYYEELLDTYDKKYDIDDLNQRIVEAEIEPNLEEHHIDLPRSDTTQEKPTSKDISTGSSESTTTTTDKMVLIDLKNRYMRQIRNVYNEFASRFDDCFLHIY